MKPFYEKYTEWECYKNGMYNCENLENEDDLIEQSASLLKDNLKFKNVANKVVSSWVISAMVHLTNPNINRKAWIGQASCFYNHKCPEIVTRKAWASLTIIERAKANAVAESVINNYLKKLERSNNQLHF
jgi:hypothetical protein